LIYSTGNVTITNQPVVLGTIVANDNVVVTSSKLEITITQPNSHATLEFSRNAPPGFEAETVPVIAQGSIRKVSD